MIDNVVRNLGPFFVPQLMLSVVTVALVLGYLIAWLRQETEPARKPWNRTLDPLCAISVSVGLLGMVLSVGDHQ